MKKQILLVLLVAALLLSACTIGLPSQAIEQSQPNEQQAGNIAESQDNNQQAANSNAAETNAASNPTSEPTQQFVENEDNTTAYIAPTPNPNTVKHDDMLGLWQLVVWEDTNIGNGDMVFYEITTSMMNVSTYTNNPAYGDFNYTYQNGNIDFGNGAYEVILDSDVLVFMSRSTSKMIAFQPITETEIKNLVGSRSNTDTSLWEIITPTPLVVQLEIVPTGPSNRSGYPFHDGELAYNIPEGDLVGELANKTWRTYGYQWSDGSIVHDFAAYNEYVFNSDYSFTHNHSFGMDTGLYEVYGVGLELFYSDGTVQYYREAFIVENQSNGYSYLYIEDPQEGYEGCYLIYEGY